MSKPWDLLKLLWTFFLSLKNTFVTCGVKLTYAKLKPLFFTGASTFPGLRKFIAEKSQTTVLALLHIAAHGLASAGCTGQGMKHIIN